MKVTKKQINTPPKIKNRRKLTKKKIYIYFVKACKHFQQNKLKKINNTKDYINIKCNFI